MQKFILFFIFIKKQFFLNDDNNEYGTLTMGLSYFNQPIAEIKECLFQTRNIFILRTSNGEIFTSQNFGFDWMKLEFENDLQFTQIKQDQIYQSYLIALTNKNIFVLSKNCFLDYEIKTIQNVNKINSIQLNEYDENKLIIEATKITLERIEDEIIKKKNKQLFYSANFGKDIKLIQQNIFESLWNTNDKNNQRILCILKNPKNISQDDIWNTQTKLVMTDDYFDNVIFLDESINKLIKTKKYFYASKIINNQQQNIKLYLFDDKNNQLKQIQIPQDIEDYSYTIQNENQKEIFIHITHEKNENFGNLYLSENGVNFLLVQENVIKDSYGFIDLVKMKWSDGTFVLNTVTQNNKQTLISHNFGISWNVFNNENPIHFHQQSSDYFTSLFSDQNIPGLILGNGNEGNNLKDSIKNIFTYISIDYGQNFKKIFDYPCMFQSSKDGNFLVLIQENEPTTKMSFSVDQGHSFKTIQILEDNFQVLDIQRSDYDNFQFLINGVQIVRDQKYGIIIPIDFKKLLEKECEQDQLHEINSPCILGYKQKIQRKKITSICLQNNQQSQIIEQCECTSNDYINGYFFKINKCKLKKIEQDLIDELPLGIFDLIMISVFCILIFMYKNKVRKIWKQRNHRFFEINDKIKINQFLIIYIKIHSIHYK